MPMPIKPTPEKHCAHCGAKLERKRFKSGALESLLHFGRRKYCGRPCMAAAFDERDGLQVGWSTAHHHSRKKVKKGCCEICGSPGAKDVDHKDGNHLNNSRDNLQRICRSCHMKKHRPKTLCVICGKPQKGLGYCDKHYQRFKKWGDPLAVKDNQFTALRSEQESNPKRVCKVNGCGLPYHAKGYCSKHAMQNSRGKLKE